MTKRVCRMCVLMDDCVCVCVVLSSCLSFMARSVRLGRRRRCTVGMQRCKHAAHGGSCRVVARYAHDSAEPLLLCAHQATLRAHRVDGPKLLALDAHVLTSWGVASKDALRLCKFLEILRDAEEEDSDDDE